ncbi:MAG: ATP-dependent metallopeptidase FtsH/Yme1/Tma family protein, partial [Chitinimonas sp.]|nr:ATP-dependent metallopeptidase FtsH/Yme1/Tma family protein [Chitinimonas sp.]
MNNLGKNIAIWVIIGLVLMTVFNQFSKGQEQKTQVPYSQFMSEVQEGRIASIEIEGDLLRGQWIRGKRNDGTSFSSFAPFDFRLVDTLIKHNVKFGGKPQDEPSLLMS